MAILQRIALKLPVLRKSQTCPACGESFACELSLAKGCWCAEVKLSEAARKRLREKYTTCLCWSCLAQAEDSVTK
jgi:hypothetical protein